MRLCNAEPTPHPTAPTPQEHQPQPDLQRNENRNQNDAFNPEGFLEHSKQTGPEARSSYNNGNVGFRRAELTHAFPRHSPWEHQTHPDVHKNQHQITMGCLTQENSWNTHSKQGQQRRKHYTATSLQGSVWKNLPFPPRRLDPPGAATTS